MNYSDFRMFCCKGVIMESKKDEIVVFNNATLVFVVIKSIVFDIKKVSYRSTWTEKSRGASRSKTKIWDKNN